MKPFIRKYVFIQHQFCMMLIGAFVFMLPFTALGKEDLRIWKPVRGVKSIEFAVHCEDSYQNKTCYWWFRNLGETAVSLTYAMVGDGYTIKPTAVRVKGGRIVPKTEIVLPPNYKQPNFEGFSGQFIGADDLQDVAVIGYRLGDSDAKPTLEQAKRISAAIAVSENPTMGIPVELKSAVGFCRTGYEVLIDSCRCLPDAKRDSDKSKGKMICRQKRVSSSSSDDVPELVDEKPTLKGSSLPVPSSTVQYGPPPPPSLKSVREVKSVKKVPCDRSITSCPPE